MILATPSAALQSHTPCSDMSENHFTTQCLEQEMMHQAIPLGLQHQPQQAHTETADQEKNSWV